MLHKSIILIFFLGLLSCASDNKSIQQNIVINQKLNLDSLYHVQTKAFNSFLFDLSQHSTARDFKQSASDYFPDSIFQNGTDLFGYEIHWRDSVKMVFFENAGIEKAPSNIHLGIFTSTGKTRDILSLKKVSYDGNVAVNLIDEEVIEIEYYDFYPEGKSPQSIFDERDIPKAIPMSHSSSKRKSKRKKIKVIEAFFHDYYKVSENGEFILLEKTEGVSESRKYPQASLKILSISEIERYSAKKLKYMKSEIYADHGFSFYENKKMRRHFRKLKWYKSEFDNIENFLSDIEKINLKKINQMILEKE